MVPVPGRLIYRGYDIVDLVKGSTGDDRYGFEEAAYLLLFGQLPDHNAQQDFQQLLARYQRLPAGFARDMILKSTQQRYHEYPGKKYSGVIHL